MDQQLLEKHLSQIGARWDQALAGGGYDAAIVLAGGQGLYFQDDQGPPFVPNPYLSQWVGRDFALEGSALLVEPGARPILFVHRPEDFWHAPGATPEHLGFAMDLEVHASSADLFDALRRKLGRKRAAVVGPEDASHNEAPGDRNPAPVMHRLAWGRAEKTEFEIARMRCASESGARGHLAAQAAFHAGASEFEIHLAYLGASRQNEHQTPYPNIIAQNEHASLLHYQHQERDVPDPLLSLLIDAGGSDSGYASDITRTHVRANDESSFGALIAAMQAHQDELIASVRPGVNYLDLHVQMHRQLADVLVGHGLLNCSADEAFETHLTEHFCPHGLGHLLGLQVHDIGGQQAGPDGGAVPPPEHYPSLRLTRNIEENQVFTIEPGLYFIPSLLAELKSLRAPVAWPLVESLIPYGGIRIEDNVRVLTAGVENLTRDAFVAVADAS